MKKKVLFVAVHPDDETLGCGGTILKHKNAGDEISWLILTSIRNHPSGRWDEKAAEGRDLIVTQVAKEYQFDNVVDLGLPTTMLDRIELGKIVSLIGEKLDTINPEIVYMMFQNDVHSDHRVAFSAVYSCLKSFRRPFIKRILMFEALSETEFAVSNSANSFVPNVYVDITDYMEDKLRIMSHFKTEVMQSPYPRSLESIRALGRYRGTRAGVEYAEAFMLIYEQI